MALEVWIIMSVLVRMSATVDTENEVYTGCGFEPVPGQPQALKFCDAYGQCMKTQCSPDHVFSKSDCGCVQALQTKSLGTIPDQGSVRADRWTETPQGAIVQVVTTDSLYKPSTASDEKAESSVKGPATTVTTTKEPPSSISKPENFASDSPKSIQQTTSASATTGSSSSSVLPSSTYTSEIDVKTLRIASTPGNSEVTDKPQTETGTNTTETRAPVSNTSVRETNSETKTAPTKTEKHKLATSKNSEKPETTTRNPELVLNKVTKATIVWSPYLGEPSSILSSTTATISLQPVDTTINSASSWSINNQQDHNLDYTNIGSSKTTNGPATTSNTTVTTPKTAADKPPTTKTSASTSTVVPAAQGSPEPDVQSQKTPSVPPTWTSTSMTPRATMTTPETTGSKPNVTAMTPLNATGSEFGSSQAELACGAEINITGISSNNTLTGRGAYGFLYIGIRGVTAINGSAHFNGRSLMWIPYYEGNRFTSGLTIIITFKENATFQKRQSLINNCGDDVTPSVSIIIDPKVGSVKFKVMVAGTDKDRSLQEKVEVLVPYTAGTVKTLEMQTNGERLVGRVDSIVVRKHIPSKERYEILSRSKPLYIGAGCRREESDSFQGEISRLEIYRCVRAGT